MSLVRRESFPTQHLDRSVKLGLNYNNQYPIGDTGEINVDVEYIPEKGDIVLVDVEIVFESSGYFSKTYSAVVVDGQYSLDLHLFDCPDIYCELVSVRSYLDYVHPKEPFSRDVVSFQARWQLTPTQEQLAESCEEIERLKAKVEYLSERMGKIDPEAFERVARELTRRNQ